MKLCISNACYGLVVPKQHQVYVFILVLTGINMVSYSTVSRKAWPVVMKPTVLFMNKVGSLLVKLIYEYNNLVLVAVPINWVMGLNMGLVVVVVAKPKLL